MLLRLLLLTTYRQFDHILANFQSLWQQLLSPNCPHSQAIFVKVSKSFVFLLKSFWATLVAYYWSHCLQSSIHALANVPHRNRGHTVTNLVQALRLLITTLPRYSRNIENFLVRMTQGQCDKIRRNFATLAKIQNSWQESQDLFGTGQSCEPDLAQLACCWANFHCCSMKTIWPSGHTAVKSHNLPL